MAPSPSEPSPRGTAPAKPALEQCRQLREEGSLVSDAYRLPRTVVPSRYDLLLTPDLGAATFAGDETITVTVHAATQAVVLNAVELQIGAVAATDGRGRTLGGSVELQPEHDRAQLTFPEPLQPGVWRLRLTFTSVLNDKLRGFYRSRYVDANGVEHVLAATQLEATDARRAFPCWDEPAFKAVFAVSLVVDPTLTAVSNTSVVGERVERGRKVVTFADTMKMSTYLVAFVVGELEATDAVLVGRTPV